MVLDGTQLFVVGTAALTLPSLLTTYWKELFITRPPLSSAYVREHGFVSFQVEPRFKLLTPKHTFVTHMFRHSDLLHWFTNMYSMATSAAFLDLGFWRSSLLFYGGGIAGAASQILERTMLRDSRSRLTIEPAREWLREAGDQLSNWIAGKPTEDAKIIGLFSGLFPTTFSMCGASGGVFALIGAETYLISVALWRILTGRERSRRHLREQRLADLIAMIASRALGMGLQLAGALDAARSPAAMPVWPDTTAFNIGYSAHIGGFVFGMLTMRLLNNLFPLEVDSSNSRLK